MTMLPRAILTRATRITLLRANFIQSKSFSTSEDSTNKFVHIVEVGPRDGLQNEKAVISTKVKEELICRLFDAGLTNVEVTSFVSPKWVPQMGDADAVCAAVASSYGVQLRTSSQRRAIALTPNIKGLESALRMREKTQGLVPNAVAVFAAASEGFSKANINCTIEESLSRFEPVLEKAKANGMPVRGYVSCVIECPYDGPTPPESVALVADRLHQMGCYEVSLGDTIGKGRPESTTRMLTAVLSRVPVHHLALHYHDTYGHAVENLAAGLQLGIRTVDCSVAGLGGCPYAGPGAPGNVDSSRVVKFLHQQGYSTGVQEDKLEQIAVWIRQELRKPAAKL